MKRRFALLLAAVLCLGALPCTACEEPETEQPPEEEHEKLPETPPQLDEATRDGLLASFLQTDFDVGMVEFSLRDLNCPLQGGGEIEGGSFAMTLDYRLNEDGMAVDAYGTGTLTEGVYALGFVRGDSAFYGFGTGDDTRDFSSLLELYAKEDGPALERRALPEAIFGVPLSLLVRCATNLTRLSNEGFHAEKTETGYALTFDASGTMRDLFSGLAAAARSYTADTTLGAVFGNFLLSAFLRSLSYGVKAAEVTELSLLEKYKSLLPRAGERGLYEYIEFALTSESYFDSLSLGAVSASAHCLSDLTFFEIAKVLKLYRDEEGTPLKGDELRVAVEGTLKEGERLFASLAEDPLGVLFEKVFPSLSLSVSGTPKMTFSLLLDEEKRGTGSKIFLSSTGEGGTLTCDAEIAVTFGTEHAFTDISGLNVLPDGA